LPRYSKFISNWNFFFKLGIRANVLSAMNGERVFKIDYILNLKFFEKIEDFDQDRIFFNFKLVLYVEECLESGTECIWTYFILSFEMRKIESFNRKDSNDLQNWTEWKMLLENSINWEKMKDHQWWDFEKWINGERKSVDSYLMNIVDWKILHSSVWGLTWKTNLISLKFLQF
jgi:hypothetical protein